LWLVLGGQATATESDVIVEIEGNRSCNALFDAKGILEARDRPKRAGVPIDIKGGDEQRFTYTISTEGDRVGEWHTDSRAKPVLFAIVTAQRGKSKSEEKRSRVFYYPNTLQRPGVSMDTDLQAVGPISEVTFCYSDADPAAPPRALDECPENLCGQDPDDDLVVVRLNPDKPQWGVKTCACPGPDTATFEPCNPAAEVGTPGACQEPVPPDAEPFVPIPVGIEAGQDPWVCFTLNGQRKCYCRDLDSKKAGCQ
jgi:hypothetical protein